MNLSNKMTELENLWFEMERFVKTECKGLWNQDKKKCNGSVDGDLRFTLDSTKIQSLFIKLLAQFMVKVQFMVNNQ